VRHGVTHQDAVESILIKPIW